MGTADGIFDTGVFDSARFDTVAAGEITPTNIILTETERINPEVTFSDGI